MEEVQSLSSSGNNQENDSSFHSLRQSDGQIQQKSPDIVEIVFEEDYNQRSLKQSVAQTYKMCCSGLRTIKTNIAYNIKHSNFDIFTKREKVILNKNQSITLLGKNYQNNSQQKEQFYIDFQNVVWLTYRSGINGFQSDAGWGCMIRVCQMVLAESFKRIQPKLPLKQVIEFFKDTTQAQFSLTKICQKGNIKQRWTSSIQIFTILRSISDQFKDLNLSVDIHSSCIQIQPTKQLHKFDYPCLIFVSNRLGKDRFQQAYQQHLFDILEIPFCVGIIGGNGGQALYLIGHYAKKIIFMDPHYVQSTQQSPQRQVTSTYFQSQPYCIDITQLAPSIAFNFLVKSKQEYYNLLEKLYELQLKHNPYICLQIISDELKSVVKNVKSYDDAFEVI